MLQGGASWCGPPLSAAPPAKTRICFQSADARLGTAEDPQQRLAAMLFGRKQLFPTRRSLSTVYLSTSGIPAGALPLFQLPMLCGSDGC